MFNRSEYEEEEIFNAKRVLQDHYTIMVNGLENMYEENNPDNGEKEETAKLSRDEYRII